MKGFELKRVVAFIEFAGLQTEQWLWLLLAAVLIGLSRTAISGFGMLAVPVLATIFGGKESTGIILPMLITADIFAITYFHKKADRKTFSHLLPWAFAGLAAGAFIGNAIDDRQFRMIIGTIVIICVLILLFFELRGTGIRIPDNIAVYALIGTAVGFASMVGNSAGPIFWIYLIARSMKKTEFMGTAALFFFIMNITKLPLQIFVWDNIRINTLIPALIMIPVIIGAAFAGTFIIRHINEKIFKYIVIGMIFASAIRLLF